MLKYIIKRQENRELLFGTDIKVDGMYQLNSIGYKYGLIKFKKKLYHYKNSC